jgi:hypothetical protein
MLRAEEEELLADLKVWTDERAAGGW